MTRDIIKSNIAFVATQNTDEAFVTGGSPFAKQQVCLYGGVQEVNYSIQLPRQNLKQVGSQNFVFNGIMQQPDVELTVSFLGQPWMTNECNGGFLMETPTTAGKGHYLTGLHNMFSGVVGKSTNFYVFMAPTQGTDALNSYEITFDDETINLSGFDAMAFGNCFPTTYGLSYAVGGLPIVSTNYVCSNVVFENITGETMNSPAVNLESGNSDNAALTSFTFSPNVGYTISQKVPPILNPVNTYSNITLQNMQVGGQNLSGTHFVQSLNLSVDLPRVSSYGLGNDFAYNRKAQFPANGRFSVSSLVSGLDAGVLTGVLDGDQDYNFELRLAADVDSSENQALYKIENAKLNSYAYGMAVNGQMQFDADFSFAVTETEGLKISGHCDSTVFH